MFWRLLQNLGEEVLDPDMPTYIEAKLFCCTGGKFVWMFLQPLFYAFRPLFVNPLPPTTFEVINVIIQLSFDAFVYYYFGNYQYTISKLICPRMSVYK